MIGIIAAIEDEFNAVYKLIKDKTTRKKANLSFTSGKLLGSDVVLVQCGVGKVNAACCTQAMIDTYDVDCVINMGVGGALASGLGIGDVVLSRDAMQYDIDASCFGNPVGEIPGLGKTFFEADQNLLSTAELAAQALELNALTGRIMTADLGLSDPVIKQRLIEQYDGAICEMEGAAVAQVCYLNDVPFLIIRTVSDNADDSASESFFENKEQSSDRGAFLLCLLIYLLGSEKKSNKPFKSLDEVRNNLIGLLKDA